MPFKENNKFGLQNRTKEERRKIALMGVEKAKKNKEEKMKLQKCMKALLDMKVSEESHEEVLRKFGFEGKDLINSTLLMVALFRKGLAGDVNAVKEICAMMEKLEIYKTTNKMSGVVNINIIPVGEPYTPTAEDEEEIRKAEQKDIWKEENNEWNMDVFEEEEEEWGNETYEGK